MRFLRSLNLFSHAFAGAQPFCHFSTWRSRWHLQTVAFTGGRGGNQCPGSRVLSAQKASTAKAFSLPSLALSMANLFSVVRPGGNLYRLQHSTSVD